MSLDNTFVCSRGIRYILECVGLFVSKKVDEIGGQASAVDRQFRHWRNKLQFGETVLKLFANLAKHLSMVLIANIRSNSMSDTRVVVFHNSLITIHKMTTRSPAAAFVKAPTLKASLSCCMTLAML